MSLPVCAPGRPDDMTLVASWAPCRGDPSFLQTINGSGCCPSDKFPLGTFGVCDECSQVYTCEDAHGAFPWGIVVAVIADTIISVGLALQKVAHNRVEAKIAMSKKLMVSRKEEEAVATKRGKEAPPGRTLAEMKTDKAPTYPKEQVWWAGIALTIGAEIGNFAAYGDPNTPASVVASMGCVAVISNWMIATLFLGEKFRRRDLAGVSLVIIGVVRATRASNTPASLAP